MFLPSHESSRDTFDDASMSFKKSYEQARQSFKPMTRKGLVRGKGMKRGTKRIGRVKGTIHADSVWSWAIRARDDHRCRKCGKRDEVNNHAHHIAPRSRRPDLKKVLSNGATVCPPCHDWIHRNPIEAEAAGLLSSETYEMAMRL